MYRRNVYEVKGGSEEHPTHIKALDMSHSLSETSNYTSINEVHWRDKTVNTVAWLATEERSGTHSEVEIHAVLGRAQDLDSENGPCAHPNTRCAATQLIETQLPLFLNREHNSCLLCHSKEQMTFMKIL